MKFILNVAEDQALLPGRVPGFKRVDVKLLPSVLTKHSLWKTYPEICTGNGQTSVGYSKFCNLWNQLCPFVVITCAATDLCWTCQKNNFIQKSVNMPEGQKQRLSGLKNNIFDSLLEKESCTGSVASNQKRTFANTCKRLILTLDAHLAHTMEPFTFCMTTLKNSPFYSSRRHLGIAAAQTRYRGSR